MALVTITLTVGPTCNYWMVPQAIQSPTGLGVTAPNIVEGFLPNYGTPSTLSVQLDNAFLWDISLDFQNAPPITVYGFQPGSGGDLLELLTAQGWTSLGSP